MRLHQPIEIILTILIFNHRVHELLQLSGVHSQQRLPLSQQPLRHHLHSDADGCTAVTFLAATSLQNEQPAILYCELHLLCSADSMHIVNYVKVWVREVAYSSGYGLT